MVLALTFPGEEAFYSRMGVELYENYKEVLPVYKTGKASGKIDLAETLLYENEEWEWDSLAKRIAVLVTSVACYTAWKTQYNIEPQHFIGHGTGLLSALVCTGSISLRTAIHCIQGKKPSKLWIKENTSSVISLKSGKQVKTKEEIQEEIQSSLEGDASYEGLKDIAEQYELEQFLEIGPGNRMTEYIRNTMPEKIAGYLDKTEDNNYILEHFQYHKNQSRYYGVLRMLGIITSTKNNSEDEETFSENIITAYMTVKEVVDKATMALFKGEPPVITEEEMEKCLKMLHLNFSYKKTEREEVFERLFLLEGETLMSLREGFEDLYE